jgi:hypothetical protein
MWFLQTAKAWLSGLVPPLAAMLFAWLATNGLVFDAATQTTLISVITGIIVWAVPNASSTPAK